MSLFCGTHFAPKQLVEAFYLFNTTTIKIGQKNVGYKCAALLFVIAAKCLMTYSLLVIYLYLSTGGVAVWT